MGDLAARLVGFTGDPFYVENLDLVTFNALCESVLRLQAQDRLSEAWTRWCAAQCTEKGMRNWVKQWEDEVAVKNPKVEGKRLAGRLGAKTTKI